MVAALICFTSLMITSFITAAVHLCISHQHDQPLSLWIEQTQATECDWYLFLSEEDVYVNYPALTDRLRCFPSNEEPLAFARMSGRLSKYFAIIGNDSIFFGIIRTGLLLNRCAMDMIKVSSISIDNSVPVLPLGGSTIDQVEFLSIDIQMSLFLFKTIKLKIQNWANYIDHYLIGGSDTVIRRKAEIRSQNPNAPCVLAAYPANPDTVDILHQAVCNQGGRSMNYVQYSWEVSEGVFANEPYYSAKVVEWLGTCDLIKETDEASIASHSVEVVIPPSGNIMLSAPGGGTTWFFEILRQNAISHYAIADMFHPYVNEVFRAELSICFSAGEDETSKDLFTERLPHCDPVLPLLIDSVTNSKSFFTKEVMNIFRMLQINEQFPQIHILLLYRSRQSTFPTVGNDTCRMCFYDAFHRSLVATNSHEPWIIYAKEFIAQFSSDSIEAAILIHTVLWRYIFSKIPPNLRNLIIYDEIVNIQNANDLERLLNNNWNLNSIVDTHSAVADLLVSRESPEWLTRRHIEYFKLGVEPLVIQLLQQLRTIDPTTDTSLLILS